MPRLALCCTEPGCAWRHFFDSAEAAKTARCPNHPTKTAVQKNRPYFGKPVDTPRVGNLPVVDPTKAPARRRA